MSRTFECFGYRNALTTSPAGTARCPIKVALILFLWSTGALAGVGVWTGHGPEGGPISALAVDPTNPLTLYAGGSGVFKSTDGGKTGGFVGLSGYLVETLLVDPSNPSTVYAGTINGVFKSVDGGSGWSAANTGLTGALYTLLMDNRQASTLYAGTDDGVFKTVDRGANWVPVNNGLMDPFLMTGRSVVSLAADGSSSPAVYAVTSGGDIFKTSDGGGRWEPVGGPPAVPRTYRGAFAVDPVAPSTFYAAFDFTVFKTTDGGRNWDATGLVNRSIRSLAIDPSRSTTLYAAGYDGFFKSRDAGATWIAIPIGYSASPTFNTVVIDPSSPSTLYAGTSSYLGAFRSTDGGQTWSTVHFGMNFSLIRSVAADPVVLGTVYAASGNGGGVFRSRNGGKTWTEINTGLRGSTNVLAVAATFPPTLYAGTSEGVFKSSDGGEGWETVNDGLSASNILALAIDPSAPTTLYAGTSGGRAFRSDDSGKAWRETSVGLPASPTIALAIDPATPSTIYAGTSGSGVFKSADGGSSWSAASNGLTDRVVLALAIGPGQPSILYAGTWSLVPGPAGALFESNDGGASWKVSEGLAGWPVYALAVDPSDPSILYAGSPVLVFPASRPARASGGPGVFRSTDRGRTWSPFNDGLTNRSVLALAIGPAGAHVYAGIEFGGVFGYQMPCAPAVDRLCLLQKRFSATVEATDPRTGRTIAGRAVAQGDRFGYFSLPDLTGDPTLPEVLVKMADPGPVWVFHNGLTDLRYTLRVMDFSTGEVKAYRHSGSAGPFCGGGDISTFFNSPPPLPPPASCVPDQGILCLLNGRFQVSLTASDSRTGATSPGRAVAKGERFGYFSLPDFTGDPTFPEVFIKMADLTSAPAPFGGSFWVFHAGLTDLRYSVTVRDVVFQYSRTYANDGTGPKLPCGGADTSAFQD
jgi:photosystem II stability/assembly factor-like uncharacterized protein